MLVLSRFRNQKVIITDRRTGDVITVTLADIRGDKARIGFDASDDYRIHRDEVESRIAGELANESSGDGRNDNTSSPSPLTKGNEDECPENAA